MSTGDMTLPMLPYGDVIPEHEEAPHNQLDSTRVNVPSAVATTSGSRPAMMTSPFATMDLNTVTDLGATGEITSSRPAAEASHQREEVPVTWGQREMHMHISLNSKDGSLPAQRPMGGREASAPAPQPDIQRGSSSQSGSSRGSRNYKHLWRRLTRSLSPRDS